MPAQYPGNAITKAARAASGGGFESAVEASAGSVSYTISGSGFGTKQPYTPSFDDFEDLTLGGVPSNGIGALYASVTTGLSVEATARDGGKCLVNDYALVGFPKLRKTLSGTGKIGYMGCWVKRQVYGTITGNTPVWKYGRVGSNAAYSGCPKLSHEHTGISDWSPSGQLTVLNSMGDCAYGGSASMADTNPQVHPENTWQFYEVEYDYGTPGNTDCFFEIRIDGAVSLAYYGPEGYTFIAAGQTAFPDWMLTPLNGMGEQHPIYVWLDDVYIDESRARAVLTDSAVYANSTKWAVQPIASFSDTSVTATGKRQDFAVGATAYLHLFDDAGVLVSEGNSVTVQEDAA